jgi:hypothetical protein
MSDGIEIYANAPKKLVVIEVKVDGVVVTDNYKVCIYPTGVRPLDTDTGWIDPETGGDDTGIFIGSQSERGAFAAGMWLQPWYYLTDSPEIDIQPSNPRVKII